MTRIFADDDMEALILVDASNAFNRLNRQVTLLNSEDTYASTSPILINTHHNDSYLFVDGQCMLSKEGTTQGDLSGDGHVCFGTSPLIRRLEGVAKQMWYTDNSAAGSSLERLKEWWDMLVEVGPFYGYFPNDAKTHIITRVAREIFQGTRITISAEEDIISVEMWVLLPLCSSLSRRSMSGLTRFRY